MKFWDYIPAKGMVWDPIKKATGLTDAQMAGIGGLAVAAPFAAPALMGAEAASAAGTGLTTSGLGSGAGFTIGGTGGTGAGFAAGSNATLGAGAGSTSGGLLASFDSYAKPALTTMQGATLAKGLLTSPQTQIQAPQLPQYQDMSGLAGSNQSQLAALQQKRMARRGLLGG